MRTTKYMPFTREKVAFWKKYERIGGGGRPTVPLWICHWLYLVWNKEILLGEWVGRVTQFIGLFAFYLHLTQLTVREKCTTQQTQTTKQTKHKKLIRFQGRHSPCQVGEQLPQFLHSCHFLLSFSSRRHGRHQDFWVRGQRGGKVDGIEGGAKENSCYRTFNWGKLGASAVNDRK